MITVAQMALEYLYQLPCLSSEKGSNLKSELGLTYLHSQAGKGVAFTGAQKHAVMGQMHGG